jgi:hypothetical protein
VIGQIKLCAIEELLTLTHQVRLRPYLLSEENAILPQASPTTRHICVEAVPWHTPRITLIPLFPELQIIAQLTGLRILVHVHVTNNKHALLASISESLHHATEYSSPPINGITCRQVYSNEHQRLLGASIWLKI